MTMSMIECHSGGEDSFNSSMKFRQTMKQCDETIRSQFGFVYEMNYENHHHRM
jgi:hypothetical protein